MNQIAALAVKVVSGGATAVVLTLGVTAGLAQAASPSPTPSPTVNASVAPAGVHDAIHFAIFESEAAVLRVPEKAFRADLERGITVERLARERGMNKEQFGNRLVVNLTPRLERLVDLKVITRAQKDATIDRIQKGYIPWWDGRA